MSKRANKKPPPTRLCTCNMFCEKHEQRGAACVRDIREADAGERMPERAARVTA